MGNVGRGCAVLRICDVSAEQLLSGTWVGTRGRSLQGLARILGQKTRGGGGGT